MSAEILEPSVADGPPTAQEIDEVMRRLKQALIARAPGAERPHDYYLSVPALLQSRS